MSSMPSCYVKLQSLDATNLVEQSHCIQQSLGQLSQLSCVAFALVHVLRVLFLHQVSNFGILMNSAKAMLLSIHFNLK